MSEGRTWGGDQPGPPVGSTGGGEAGQPSLRGFVHDRVTDLFNRLGGDDCDGLYTLVMGEVEGSLIEAVMKETSGNQGRAARILGINRGTLRKKLQAHGLGSLAARATNGGGG